MIQFEEKAHTYTRNGNRYLSVTQLLGKYEPFFDTEYWSLYKAIKDVFELKGLWYSYKQHVGGWENVVNYFTTHGSKHEVPVRARQNEYKQQWIEKNRKAIERGSGIHKTLEMMVNNQKHIVVDRSHIKPNYGKYMPLGDFTSEQIFTEPYLWSDDYQLAGQSDIIIKLARRVRIKDYKTNEEITTEAFNGQTFAHPLEHLPFHKYNLYTMQLSIYGWMLEEWGFRVEDLELIHITESGAVTMKCYYLKDEVIELVKHYKANSLI